MDLRESCVLSTIRGNSIIRMFACMCRDVVDYFISDGPMLRASHNIV
jgi:hypothetical protein